MNNSQKKTTEISIKEIIAILLKRILIIVISAVAGFVLLLLYSLFFIKPQYSSSAYFTVTNIAEENIGDSLSPSVIQASQALVKTIAVLIPVSPVYTTAAEKCGVERATVSRAVSISINTDTFVMEAKVTTSSPELSRDIAKALGETIPSYIKSVSIGSASLCNEPALPLSQSYPKPIRFGFIGLLIGLVLSSTIILIATLSDNTVKGEEDLSEKIDKPILAEVPSLDENKKKQNPILAKIPYFKKRYLKKHKRHSSDDIVNKHTAFSIVESYKQLRANLIFAASVGKNNVIIFSSGLPNEGKSTTACNVAITLAQDNKKVLLIDADMRKSTIHKKLRLENRQGLSGILSGQYPAAEAIKKDVLENLDVITAGTIPPNPSELLGSEAMDKLIETLSPDYDFVLIDTPPISVVADARNFASKTAGVVLVVRQKVTVYGDVIRSIQSVDQAASDVLGVVITDVSAEEKIYGGYYGKSGSYKYSYKYSYSGAYAESTSRNRVDLKDDD